MGHEDIATELIDELAVPKERRKAFRQKVREIYCEGYDDGYAAGEYDADDPDMGIPIPAIPRAKKASAKKSAASTVSADPDVQAFLKDNATKPAPAQKEPVPMCVPGNASAPGFSEGVPHPLRGIPELVVVPHEPGVKITEKVIGGVTVQVREAIQTWPPEGTAGVLPVAKPVARPVAELTPEEVPF